MEVESHWMPVRILIFCCHPSCSIVVISERLSINLRNDIEKYFSEDKTMQNPTKYIPFFPCIGISSNNIQRNLSFFFFFFIGAIYKKSEETYEQTHLNRRR